MLPKNNRLNLSTEFKEVAGGKRLESKDLVVFVKNAPSSPASLVGVAVSKKVCAKAVDRNALKRKVFLAVEQILGQLKESLKIVIMPKASSKDTSTKVLESELEEVLKGYV